MKRLCEANTSIALAIFLVAGTVVLGQTPVRPPPPQTTPPPVPPAQPTQPNTVPPSGPPGRPTQPLNPLGPPYPRQRSTNLIVPVDPSRAVTPVVPSLFTNPPPGITNFTPPAPVFPPGITNLQGNIQVVTNFTPSVTNFPPAITNAVPNGAQPGRSPFSGLSNASRQKRA